MSGESDHFNGNLPLDESDNFNSNLPLDESDHFNGNVSNTVCEPGTRLTTVPE